MRDDIDPRGWYWVEPPGYAKFKARGYDVIRWIDEGREANYWPVEASPIIKNS